MNNCVKGGSAGHGSRLECKTDWLARVGVAPVAGVVVAVAPAIGIGVAFAPVMGEGITFAPETGAGGTLSDAI
jgi:hypothetical protein